MCKYIYTDTRFVYRVFVYDLFLSLEDMDFVYNPAWLYICIYLYLCVCV